MNDSTAAEKILSEQGLTCQEILAFYQLRNTQAGGGLKISMLRGLFADRSEETTVFDAAVQQLINAGWMSIDPEREDRLNLTTSGAAAIEIPESTRPYPDSFLEQAPPPTDLPVETADIGNELHSSSPRDALEVGFSLPQQPSEPTPIDDQAAFEEVRTSPEAASEPPSDPDIDQRLADTAVELRSVQDPSHEPDPELTLEPEDVTDSMLETLVLNLFELRGLTVGDRVDRPALEADWEMMSLPTAQLDKSLQSLQAHHYLFIESNSEERLVELTARGQQRINEAATPDNGMDRYNARLCLQALRR